MTENGKNSAGIAIAATAPRPITGHIGTSGQVAIMAPATTTATLTKVTMVLIVIDPNMKPSWRSKRIPQRGHRSRRRNHPSKR